MAARRKCRVLYVCSIKSRPNSTSCRGSQLAWKDREKIQTDGLEATSPSALQARFTLDIGTFNSLGQTPFRFRQVVIAFNSLAHVESLLYVLNLPSCVDWLWDRCTHLTYFECWSGHFFAAAHAIVAASRFLQGFLSGSFARKQA